ncbi:hypothetical protein A4H97_17530 [Niastella yeongjuensis]|uniref:Carboxyvinyl-carboxyphosphonate phosphorylmutase n=1 Tax=Niastella yeongjuensis TaxID=354355 RepID=A0A1V9E1K7_9BACT|nr:isocitrate lyase/phosphoenolpyruvate mutase family protein [Niastella yeongjuensis]OQP40018.1 hypothetical protein A4H97_17530 [Niastella yeongjuensis]SEO13758.1 Phosphoenolpyruvate phosphomutase [Niastella yeongjuensis]
MNNYEIFLQLHQQPTPFIIANAWNVKSASRIEENGYKAIATSSSAIANSLGYEDGEKIPFSELLFVIRRISACTSIPLSVDLERGYTNDLAELNDNIRQLIEAGVVGINLEDAAVKTLAECGVKRISMAVFLYNATYKHLDTLVKKVNAEQSFTSLF